jgi:transcriptional regulator of acetoin/glycerol metabolism
VPSVAPAAPTADSCREESASAAPPAKLQNYEGMLRAYLMDVLRLTKGNITQAQHVMQKPRTTVQEMFRKFDLNAFVAECRRRR